MNRIYDKALIDDMVRHLSLPIPLAKKSAEEILAIIHEGLMRDGVVNITNFGTFRLKPVAARSGFNPKTRERITIPAHQRVVFTPAKALRDQAEPQRQPSTPIEPEGGGVHTLAMSVPPAATVNILDETRPSLVDGNIDEIFIAAPEHRLDSEPSKSEDDTSPLAPHTPVVQERAVAPAGTDTIERVQTVPARVSVPADDAHRIAPAIRKFQKEQAAYTSTKRNYFLGVALTLALGLYVAFELSETAPGVLIAKQTSVIDVSPGLTAAAEESDAFNQTHVLDAAAPPVEAVVDETALTTQVSHYYFEEQTFPIARGESLWLLAKKHYQDAYLWPHIYQANTSSIANPDYLVDGETILVPSLEGPPDSLSEKDRTNIAKGYYLAYLFYKNADRSDADLALRVARRYDANVVEYYR